jgi:Domain of unknown function (DUF3846)
MQATIYETTGEVHKVMPNNGTDFTLEEMQHIVGGYIEVLELPGTNEIMILNENGKGDDLPKNETATAIFKKAYPLEKYPDNNDQLIVGTVIVCPSSMLK